jgi:TRAP-type mannitol/chloroaromatic compound transport system permease small subunit
MPKAKPVSVDDAPTHRIIELIDHFILSSGRVISWLSLLLVAAIIIQVVLRYAFSSGLVALEELQWYLYAIVVMNAVAYGVTENIHVRMDLVYDSRSPKSKAWIDIAGLLLFALPLSLILCNHGFGFVADSFRVSEVSRAPEGLPWVWAIKAILPISMGLLALAVTSRLARNIIFVFRKEET